MDANEREFSMSQKDTPVGVQAVLFNHEFHEFSRIFRGLDGFGILVWSQVAQEHQNPRRAGCGFGSNS
jgi:hypothetical protein